MRKKHLAMALSRLEGFRDPKPELEQYRTPGDVAAELLWMAHSLGDIEGKVIADLGGAGTGVLTIGACLLGAGRVYAVEVDGAAIEVLRRNVEAAGVGGECVEVVNSDVSEFSGRAEVVVMNPPFGGAQNPPHADRPFLIKAFEISDVVYSIHLAKPEVRRFIENFVKDFNFSITHRVTMPFEIPAQFSFHRKRLERITIDVYRFQRM